MNGIKIFIFTPFCCTSYRMKIKINCEFCKKIFEREKCEYAKSIRKSKKIYCSYNCFILAKINKPKLLASVTCKQCNKNFKKQFCQVKKTLNNFCSKPCAATYNNQHKTKGNKRSKLEIWLEQKLSELYPNIEIHYNRKDSINSELDIYIPSLKLAFELNGIFHYEPIYGKDKLSQIQNNDDRKFQACLERGIELCLIDTSKQKYFTEKTSQIYLDIVKNIVNLKLSETQSEVLSS